MIKINWKVRFKNKAFWAALVPAVLILIQTVAAVFGYELNLDALSEKLLAVVCAVFTVYGIFLDPTTKGVSDSEKAMTYEEPR